MVMSKKQKGFQDDEQNTFGQINERFAALFDYAFERLFDIKQLIEVKVFLYLANLQQINHICKTQGIEKCISKHIL